MFSEIMMYLAQNPEVEDWRAITIYPRRSIEQDNRFRHRSLLQSEQFQVIYLEDLLGAPSEQTGIQLMQLIVSCDSFLHERLKSYKVGLLRDNPFWVEFAL